MCCCLPRGDTVHYPNRPTDQRGCLPEAFHQESGMFDLTRWLVAIEGS
jgi:hypothetical protein